MQVPAGQRLAIMGVIILCFSIAEMVFGMGMNSVTLVADGCHNLADAGGFGIAVFANWAQANARDEKKGERIGLIGGFTNCSVTMILTFCAGFEACCRLFVAPHVYEDPHIGPLYFVCAVCGICINGFGALFLGGHGHSHGGVPCKSHSSPTPTLSDVAAGADQETALLGHGHSHGHGHGHSHGHSHGGEPCSGHGGFQEADRHGEGEHAKGQGPEAFDVNVYAMWLHTLQDAVGSFIVLICGLIVVYSGWPNAGKADAIGGLIVCVLVWLTSLPVWWQCLNGLMHGA
eukprot:Tamp_07703.p1 GENE.Tamp_07703~~Tamp_07703.p1  ORF type:complete len:331 (+),score=31.72 Tamp_07703:130-993(+)